MNTQINIHTVTLKDGSTFLMHFDGAKASAPITANFHDGEANEDWQGTPYQTANAGHDEHRAAELVAEYFQQYDNDCVEIKSVD